MKPQEIENLKSPLLWDETSSIGSDEADIALPRIRKPNKGWRGMLRFSETAKKAGVTLYALFLIARCITLVIYFGRTINCCTKVKKTSFQCRNGAFVAHDLEVEVAWVVSSVINLAIALKVLVTWHKDDSGIRPVFLKLVKLPGFWSLVLLVLAGFTGFSIMIIKNNTTLLQNMLLCLFGAQITGITLTVTILNYTRVSYFVEKAGYRWSIRCLIKLTLLLFFVEFFILFLIGSVQLGFQVTGLDLSAETSSELHKIFSVIRRFGEAIYYYQIEHFLWIKLFVDHRDILSHMEEIDYHVQ